LIELIAQTKKAKALSWEAIAKAIGMSPVWTTSVRFAYPTCGLVYRDIEVGVTFTHTI
jgi:cyanate lyase